MVEDQKILTKDVLVKLLKLIPKREFQNDEIQRILRFLKQHTDAITERDYFDALELVGFNA